MGNLLFVKSEIFEDLLSGNVAGVRKFITAIPTETFTDMVAFSNKNKELVFADWVSLVRFGAKEHPDRMDDYLAVLDSLTEKVGPVRVLCQYKSPEYHPDSRIGRDVISRDMLLVPGRNENKLVPTVEQIDKYMKDLEGKVVSAETPQVTNRSTCDKTLFYSLWGFSFLTKVPGMQRIAQKLCHYVTDVQRRRNSAKKSGENG